jgi:hypothetical protein
VSRHEWLVHLDEQPASLLGELDAYRPAVRVRVGRPAREAGGLQPVDQPGDVRNAQQPLGNVGEAYALGLSEVRIE